jgi:hypothetical protein
MQGADADLAAQPLNELGWMLECACQSERRQLFGEKPCPMVGAAAGKISPHFAEAEGALAFLNPHEQCGTAVHNSK